MSEPPPNRPRRVAVVGTSGSGKTTFSRQLAPRLGVRHVELDALFWLPEWHEPDRAAFGVELATLLDRTDGWVADGNYSSVQHLVFERADTIVWLDIGLVTCLWRVSARAVRRAWRGEVLWGTNRESWRNVVGRRSLAWWVITTHTRRRRDTAARFKAGAAGGARLLRFRSTRDADRWLASA